MITAYFDASGTMGDSTVFVMAGYLGYSPAWQRFSDEWGTALSEPRVLKYFKMSEAWARRGEFTGWVPEDRDAKLRRLAPIVNKHALASMIVTVPTRSWRRHMVGKLEHKYHNRPYYFAFHGAMSSVPKFLHQKGIEDQIEFVFDSEGGEPVQEILDGFDRWAELAPDHLKKYLSGPPVFRDEKLVLPLQAADMLAWHIRRIFHDRVSEQDIPALTPIAAEMFEIEQVRTIWNDRGIADAAQFILSRSAPMYGDQKPQLMTLPDPTTFILMQEFLRLVNKA
ncbi:MAG: DUF3800 domain-containing protein [Bradyrhizobium sp.]|uniref:DUF3800 domain-containing protein n=1 Tax=Bradyrhizobium sp. TaxID=376 RepID=UPI0029BC129E|nr:DUF3800 domain-containing protein [Bradyrhizobium sp.]MDX3965144.1 DUF3800 domain-containing protein [Bradyrhizobium sp.]